MNSAYKETLSCLHIYLKETNGTGELSKIFFFHFQLLKVGRSDSQGRKSGVKAGGRSTSFSVSMTKKLTFQKQGGA